MTVTNAEYTEWLNNPSAVRCILVECVARIVTTETTLYLSSRTYEDTVAQRIYLPRVIGNSVNITERISLDGNGSISFGDVEFENNDGALDDYLGYVWTNRIIAAYIGDVTWLRADFRTIFNGITENLDSKSNRTLNAKVRDKLEQLNGPITDTKLGGITPNKDKIVPLTFGEPHNIAPLLTNPATLEYQFHDGNSERIIEVRDNGVPVSSNDSLAGGKFTLNATPAGAITCTVQGDNNGTYNETATQCIERIVTGYGEVANRFTSGDIDTANFAAFDAANPQIIGVHIDSKANVLRVCNDLADSVGGQMSMSRAGLLQLLKIELPPASTVLDITKDDIVSKTITIIERPNVEGAVKVGYAKNWRIQRNLQTGIPPEHKEMFGREWFTEEQENSSVKTIYKLSGEPEQVDTFLIEEADASTEASRRLAIKETQRTIYAFRGKPRLSELELNQGVTITHPRFNLSSTDATVTAITISWGNLIVDLEILI
ncbi:MAG: hypothetical protein IZT57_00905 [Chloroflexi bacterium]|nr:hypothetical protein [Chloroflexota bacterium]